MSQLPDDRGSATPPTDPWEQRERERARYARPAAASRRSPRKDKDSPAFEAGGYVAAGLIASIALLLLGDTPRIREDLRSLLIAAGSVIPFLLFAFVRFHVDDLRIAARRGPNPWILALLGWSLVAFYLSPYRQAAGFGIVGADLVRVFSCAFIYLLAAYGLRSPKEVSNTVVGLICLAVFVALAEFYDIGGSRQQLTQHVRLNTIFGSHEGLGTLLMLALPLPFAFALSSATEEKRRLAALAATLILGVALLMARTRSAWIGTSVSFFLVILFNQWIQEKTRVKPPSGSLLRRSASALLAFFTSPVTLLVTALIGVLLFSGVASFIQSRASITTALLDSGSRLDLWKAGARMTWDRPLTGWGLGSFLILQGRWSHIGDDVAVIVTRGGDENNNAHNYYIQWAADTGATGLVLHVAVVVAFLFVGIRGVWNLRGAAKSAVSDMPPFQRTLLAGCVAAFAGGCVDAIASPAYTFPSLSAIFWLLMGIGVAALRPMSLQSPIPALSPTSPIAWVTPPLIGAAAAALILFVGYKQTSIGKNLPRGTFQIKVEPLKRGPIAPGDRVLWRAVYRDGRGTVVNTYPGTIWEFSSPDALALEQMKRSLVFSRFGENPKYDSVLSITAPSGTSQAIIAHATFFDVYSRRYDAWSSVTVAKPSPVPASRKTK